MTILDKIRKEQVREERHQFSVGDTIRIHVKIVEGTPSVSSSFRVL
jgi:large subunit ribosomal protein L19